MMQATPHLPAMQVAEPLAGAAQTVPQAPQLSRSSSRCWQNAPHALKPVAHWKSQAPITHVGELFWGELQRLLQPLQLAGSVLRSTHSTPHAVLPWPQMRTHLESTQVWLPVQGM